MVIWYEFRIRRLETTTIEETHPTLKDIDRMVISWKYIFSCRDVRSREIGIQEIHNKGIKPNNIELIRRDYYANGGWETFLEYGDPEQDILIGLLRLRKCSKQR